MTNLLEQINNSQLESRRLGDLLSAIIDKRGITPKKLGSDWAVSGMPVISAKNIKDHSIVNRDQIRFIDDETYKKWMPNPVKAGDIILTSEAPMGELYFISKDESFCLGQRLFALRADANKLYPGYLFHFLQSSQGQHELNRRISGTAAEGIRQAELVNIEIKTPDLSIQKKVSEILDTYDAKIHNNKSIIKNLQSIAATLFNEWFVKFRFPGYEGVAFVESNLGKIPEGWRLCKLGDVIKLEYGKALKSEARKDGPFPVVGSSGIVGFHDKALVAGPGIVVGRKGNVGSLTWIDQDFYPIDTTFFVVSEMDLSFCFFMLKRQVFHSGDSAVPGLNREVAYSNDVVIPSVDLQNKYAQIANNIFTLTYKIENENKSLEASKNALLSKLI